MRTRKISALVATAGLVGMLGLMAAPAGAQTGLTSGDATAIDDSVASGTAVAVDGSTASGDATAIDGSTASGCSTAIDDSTASGASIAVDDSTTSGGVCAPSTTTPPPTTPPFTTTPQTTVGTPTTATPTTPTLARTGSDTSSLVLAGVAVMLAGWLLVGVPVRRRRAGVISIGNIFPRLDDSLAAELTAAFGPGLLYDAGAQTDARASTAASRPPL